MERWKKDEALRFSVGLVAEVAIRGGEAMAAMESTNGVRAAVTWSALICTIEIEGVSGGEGGGAGMDVPSVRGERVGRKGSWYLSAIVAGGRGRVAWRGGMQCDVRRWNFFRGGAELGGLER